MTSVVKTTVEIWGTRVEIEAHQRSKSVWVAYGEYLGKRYEGQGRSAAAAAGSLRERARYATS